MKKLGQRFLKTADEIGFDNYLVLLISLVSFSVGLLETIIDICLGLNIYIVGATFASTLVFLCVFIASHKYKFYKIAKYVLILLSILVIDSQWFLNYGSFGPVGYLNVILQCFVMILFNNRGRIIFSSIVLINITFLFYSEYHYPEIIGTYPNNNTRLSDLYLGMVVFLALASILMHVAMRFHISQKNKAQESDKLKSAFLANMSHEIRTPMNAIIGFSELLKEAQNDATRTRYINIINNSSEHLLHLIDDIIDISKIDANQFSIYQNDFSVSDTFDDILDIIRQYVVKVNKPQIKLICDYPDKNLHIQSDANRIKQVIINFLTNAVKFTDSGEVRFGCRTFEKSIEFYVKDTGIGIETDNFNKIFNRFYKVEHKDQSNFYRGSGIGLSIAQQIVKLLGGTISIASIPGKGSEFSFMLPVEFTTALSQSPESVPGHDSSIHKDTILVAEDEDSNFEYMSIFLKNKKYNVIRASNGLEAIEIVKTNPDIKLVLMDIKMPQLDGYEATRIIKSIRPELPVIAQTAFAMKSDEIKCKEAGFDDFISKPINAAALLTKMRIFLK